MMTELYDLIVMGMGPGGEEVATRAAEAGLNVLGIDKRLVGGECPYWGCIPSKAMVRAGDSLAEAARAMGLAGDVTIEPRWERVAARVREVTDTWNDAVAVKRHEERGTTILHGAARFASARAVEVDGTTYEATRGVVLATGGEPAAPPIEGLSDIAHWTNREAIETEEVPRHLVVLGAGAIGLELAQVFRRFGAEVTVVEFAPRALPMEEPEQGEAMGTVLAEEGIRLLTGVGAEAVAAALEGGVLVTLSDGSIVQGDRLLVATGRRADLATLGVEVAGLDPTARFVSTDDHQRAAEGVWAVGDVTGGGFTHVAVYEGRVAGADILGLPVANAGRHAVPRVTFTDPEVASVGLSQAQAEEAGIEVAVGVTGANYSTRAYIHGPGAQQGVIKLVSDKARGTLVGASVMGPAAGEQIGMLLLAVRAGIPVATLRDTIYPYPTFIRGFEGALGQLDV